MKTHNTHLTYCLNIHPGETWPENLKAVDDFATKVKQAICPERPFGLGLRLSAGAARTLHRMEELEKFKAFLSERGMYVFTINGFPYGKFHGGAVKENVYRPDWREADRRNYTILLCDILAELLPEGVTGSISTVPGSYKKWINKRADADEMVKHLIECAYHLHIIREKTGKAISLALEPEPDCFIETTSETIAFFKDRLFEDGAARLAGKYGLSVTQAKGVVRDHLGVCFDTCHLALQFENITESLKRLRENGISIPKIQLSSALAAAVVPEIVGALAPFLDTVYLHQTRVKRPDGSVIRYADLPGFIDGYGTELDGCALRSHFHVPLHFKGSGLLSSTVGQLDAGFFEAVREAGTPQLEIETYTFDVLPQELKGQGVIPSIKREFGKVLEMMEIHAGS